jgi:hypothetical protein
MLSLLKALLLLFVTISAVLSAPKPEDTYVVAKLPGNGDLEILNFFKQFFAAGYGAGDDYGMTVGGNVKGGRWLNHNDADVYVHGSVIDTDVTNLKK